MSKFKVGDKVKWHKHIGFIVETNSGCGNNMNLCRFENFEGHNGNGYTNRSKDYDTSDHYYCYDCELTLIEDEDEDKGVNVNMRKVENVRISSKIITIPQKKAAPQKVECKTVVMTIDGKEYEAVCMPGDEFDIKKGIEVALLKSIFGGMTEYDKYIRNLVKFYETCEKKREEEKRVVAKREKEIARKIARKQKKANAERQARVNEMSEAFLKAMRDYDGIGMDSMIDEETTHCVSFDMEKMCRDFLASKGLVAVSADTETCKACDDDLK